MEFSDCYIERGSRIRFVGSGTFFFCGSVSLFHAAALLFLPELLIKPVQIAGEKLAESAGILRLQRQRERLAGVLEFGADGFVRRCPSVCRRGAALAATLPPLDIIEQQLETILSLCRQKFRRRDETERLVEV